MIKELAKSCLIPPAVLTYSNQAAAYHQYATGHDHNHEPVSLFGFNGSLLHVIDATTHTQQSRNITGKTIKSDIF